MESPRGSGGGTAGRLQWVEKVLREAPWGPFWALLGALRALLEGILGLLGAMLGALGGHFRGSGALGGSWVASWGLWGAMFKVPGASGGLS